LLSKVYVSKAKKVVKITIDYTRCVGNAYKICVELCPASIFRNESSAKPQVVNQESCNLCRACQVNCPSQAI